MYKKPWISKRQWDVRQYHRMLGRLKISWGVSLWMLPQASKPWRTDSSTTKGNRSANITLHRRLPWALSHKITKSSQIAVLALAALVAATPFDCPPAATVTVTSRSGPTNSNFKFPSNHECSRLPQPNLWRRVGVKFGACDLKTPEESERNSSYLLCWREKIMRKNERFN